MKATFENTVDILVKAYLNGTLEHSNCYACAVGNIVAYATGKKFIRSYAFMREWKWKDCDYPAAGNDTGGWGQVITTCCLDGVPQVNLNNFYGEAKIQIESTGYSPTELSKIEFAFERADEGYSEEEWMFNGLMAVVEVLAEIHQINIDQKESAKLLFVKA